MVGNIFTILKYLVLKKPITFEKVKCVESVYKKLILMLVISNYKTDGNDHIIIIHSFFLHLLVTLQELKHILTQSNNIKSNLKKINSWFM